MESNADNSRTARLVQFCANLIVYLRANGLNRATDCPLLSHVTTIRAAARLER